MSINNRTSHLLPLLFLSLLTACPFQSTGIVVGDPIEYIVANNPQPDPETGVGSNDIICRGGLKTRMATNDLMLFESELIKAEDTYTESVGNPEGFGKGSPMTIEAWCYNEDGSQQGYARYENEVTGGIAASSVHVVGLKASSARGYCLELTSSSGEPPCISSPLFDLAP